MKFLLCAVNTKYIHSNLAVYLLKAYAEKYLAENYRHPDKTVRADIEIAEFTINNRPDEVMEGIYERKPDVLFFSCYIWNKSFIDNLAEDLHNVLPETDIWLGGPEVSFDPVEELNKRPFLTGVLLGEGEATFSELVLKYYIEGSMELKDISGISFNSPAQTGCPVINASRPLLNLDDIPFIYRDQMQAFNNRIIYYESSRGCPFHCSYCLSSVDKTVRFRSLEKVFEELGFFLENKVPQVKFVDRTFNIDHQRSAEILEYLTEHDNGITNFHFEIEGDLLSDTELEIMSRMRPGLIQLEIGVQSVNPDTLQAIHRNADLNRLKKVVEKLHRMNNIHIHLDLIAGLPYEDYDSFKNSFNEVYSMQPSQLQLGFLKILKGSPMEKKVNEYGMLFKKKPPYEVLLNDWISYEKILKLKSVEEMVELYYNSGQFTGTLTVLEHYFTSPFDLYEKLAQFYKDRGYMINTPSRLHRYQVLLDFTELYVPDKKDLFRELAVFDLYYREDLKSRPSFTMEHDQQKSIIRKAMAENETLRDILSDKRLHAEVFCYPVFKNSVNEITKREQDEMYIIVFDYSRRDPLNNNAEIVFCERI